MDKLHKDFYESRKKKKDTIKEGLKEGVEIADKLRTMMGTPGWKIVEDYLDERMNIAINLLVSSNNDRDIYFNQAVVAVIKEIFERIGVSKKIGKSAQELLKQYE